MGEYPGRSELAVGDFVEIAIYHKGNKKDKGDIESVLTHTETHTHGIMVSLTNKKIGRVQRKLPRPAKIPIDLDIAKELHDKIEKLSLDVEDWEDAKEMARVQVEEAKRELRDAEDYHYNEAATLEEAKKKLEDIKRKEKDDDSLNKRAKNTVDWYYHMSSEEKDDYDKFQEERWLENIDSKNSRGDKLKQEFPKYDIPKEEDERNEFKESFKADTIYHKLINRGDKKAAEARKHDCESKEHVVKKEVSVTAAAFANREGGRLFIGIQDDPVEVVGLESDLSEFKNFDEYIRAIQDSIKSFTKNQSFVSSIKLRHGEERKFLVLHVPASGSVPIFIHDNDKEEFYLRGYAQSSLLQYTDAHRYIRDRFPDWKP